MTEERFWELTDLARKDRAGGYHKALEKLSDADLEEFVAEYHARKRQLMTPEFLATIDGPKTPQRLAEIAEWTVSQGPKHFEAVLFGDEKFPERLPAGVEAPHLDRDASAIYKQRTGRWIPRRAPASDDIELDQEKFWQLIDLAQKDKTAFERALEQLRPEDLIAFYWEIDALRNQLADTRFKRYLHASVTKDWESWMSFTDWLLGSGRERVEGILQDPSQMPARLPKRASGYPADRDAQRVFKRRFAEDLPLPRKEVKS